MKHSNSPLDALERLNVVLGGRDDDAVNITEAIDQIADAIEAGGGGGGSITILIDPTLTKSGQAADAKAAGDAIAVAGAVDQNLTRTGVAADAAATGYAINNARVTIDSSLSNQGQAADAKAVGDAINAINIATDNTLAIAGKPADSKTVGDRLLALQNAVGSPKVANTANDMTDIDNIYVYTGSEAGYTAGHWYYYDNLMWHDGGVYNAVAVNTDSSLSVSGQAADAAAVGNLRTDLEYEPIKITEFSFEPSVAEIGSTVASASVTYRINKLPTSLTIMGNSITPSVSGTETVTGLSISDTYEVAITAADSGSYSRLPVSAIRFADLKFVNRIYYGVKAAGTLDSAFVKSLANKPLSDTKTRTITVNSTSNTYIWYAYPARLGTSIFKVGGIEGGFEPAETVSVTNDSGYTEDYYVYRSTEKKLGLTTVEIY